MSKWKIMVDEEDLYGKEKKAKEKFQRFVYDHSGQTTKFYRERSSMFNKELPREERLRVFRRKLGTVLAVILFAGFVLTLIRIGTSLFWIPILFLASFIAVMRLTFKKGGKVKGFSTPFSRARKRRKAEAKRQKQAEMEAEEFAGGRGK